MNWREILKTEIPLPSLPGWFPRNVRLILPRTLLREWWAQQGTLDMRAVFVQISAIVRTNGSLPDGLKACAQDAPNRRVKGILKSLAQYTENGIDLGDAMARTGCGLKPRWVNMVAAAGSTGQLSTALAAIMTELSEKLEFGRVPRNRIAYFGFLWLSQVLLMSFLMIRVVPVFIEILAEFSGDTPAPMRILMGVSQFLAGNYKAILVAFAAAAVFLFIGTIAYRVSGFVESVVTWAALRTPILGSVYRARHGESLATILRVLIAGGVPLPEALRETARGRLPRPHRRALMQAADEVERGTRLSGALTRHRGLLGGRFIDFVRVGEGPGEIAHALDQAADLYRRELTRTKSAMSDALVPIGVTICGANVLLISTALFAVTTAISDTIIADI